GKGVVLEKVNRDLSRVEFEGAAQALGPDWTSPGPSGSAGIELKLEAEVSVAAPTAELLVLTEAGKPLSEAVEQSLMVDGKDVPLTSSSSATGWAATGQPVKEHWLFLQGKVPSG